MYDEKLRRTELTIIEDKELISTIYNDILNIDTDKIYDAPGTKTDGTGWNKTTFPQRRSYELCVSESPLYDSLQERVVVSLDLLATVMNSTDAIVFKLV